MKEKSIKMYNVHSTIKSSMSERLIRNIKNRLWIQMDYAGNRSWIKYIDKVVDEYNHTKHSKIKMRPIDVNKHNEKEIFEKYYNIDKLDRNKYHKKVTFKLNDPVRISRKRAVFDKGYFVSYSYEVFRIRKIIMSNPVTYLLSDWKGRPIVGGFTEYELKKSKFPDVFLIEKILARKQGKVLVKYLGFSSEANEWIDEKKMI